MIDKSDQSVMDRLVAELHPAQIAEYFTTLEEANKRLLISTVSSKKLGFVLDELSQEDVVEVLDNLPIGKLSEVITLIPGDKAADLMGFLNKIKRAKIIRKLPPQTAKKLKELLQYPVDSAGGLMITELVKLKPYFTVREAVNFCKEKFTPDIPSYIYVVDNDDKLIGVIRIRSLLFEDDALLIKDIMLGNVFSVPYYMDQEEVAHLVSKYDLFCVAVVDDDERLIGTITADDLFEVIEEEDSEDLYKLAGTSETEPFREPIYKKVIARTPWLFITFFGGLTAGLVLRHFEQTLTDIVALAFFIPVVLGMAGNIGVQSSTIMVRGIALGDTKNIHLISAIFKEVLVGIFIGFLFALLAFVGAVIIVGQLRLAFVIFCSMFFAIFLASINGVLIPFACEKLNIDPAFVSGPFVTTLNDIFGVLIYFSFATLLLSVL